MAKLRHFAIVVSDIGKATEFYEKVFDLKPEPQNRSAFGLGAHAEASAARA